MGITAPPRARYCSGQHSFWSLLKDQVLGEEAGRTCLRAEGQAHADAENQGSSHWGHAFCSVFSASVQTGGRKQG